MRQLNKAIRKSIIGSWILAWLLITAMPVIHANAENSLQQPSHCPVASMEMFNNSSMLHSPNNDPSSENKFYHCPLCHCACLLFTSFPIIFANHHLYLLPFIVADHFFSLSAIFFKQPRSPPFIFH
jgi:hypothetical protein